WLNPWACRNGYHGRVRRYGPLMPPLKLLFICTHNRCRSILAEAIGRHVGGDLLQVASAGSEPAGKVHPLTLEALARHGITDSGLHSKSWDALSGYQPDFVITVCDRAAAEACPLWLGLATRVHWGLQDPSALTDDTGACQAAFDHCIRILD